MTAGHYHSRFGSIDLLGTLESDHPAYHVQVNNKPLAPIADGVPTTTYACLSAKHVKTPPQQITGACTGSRFRVVVDSHGRRKLVMLFALSGETWMLCEAGSPQGK